MEEQGSQEHYSTTEAAKVLGVGARRVQQLADVGEIEGERHGRAWRLAKWSVHRYLEEHGPGRPRVARLNRERVDSDEERRLSEQIGELREELGRLRGRAELEEVTRSTLDEQLRRERERADRLEEEARHLRDQLAEAMVRTEKQAAPHQAQEDVQEPPEGPGEVDTQGEPERQSLWRRVFGG